MYQGSGTCFVYTRGYVSLAHEATFFYKRLASLLAHKWGDDYSG